MDAIAVNINVHIANEEKYAAGTKIGVLKT